MRTVICSYCGQRAEFVDSAIIYGRSYGMIYLCRKCGAYVGVHAGTDKPKGTLANAELREMRRSAHLFFDPLWRTGPFKRQRNAAYRWLAGKMGLTVAQTHIGLFDIRQCRRVVEIVSASGPELRNMSKKGGESNA